MFTAPGGLGVIGGKTRSHLFVPHPPASREVYLRLSAEVKELGGSSGAPGFFHPHVVAPAGGARMAGTHFSIFFLSNTAVSTE